MTTMRKAGTSLLPERLRERTGTLNERSRERGDVGPISRRERCPERMGTQDAGSKGFPSPLKGLESQPQHSPDELHPEIAKRIVVDKDTGCWLWTGKTKSGYAHAHLKKCPYRGLVHRIVWRRLIGGIQQGYNIHHLCHMKHCVNPDHLTPVSASEHGRIHWVERCCDSLENSDE